MDKKRDSFFLPDKKQREYHKHDNQEKRKGNKQEFKKNRKQENFDKNRSGLDEEETKAVKKPFDKKTYRLKKYSKKYKLEQWEEQRKKKLLRNFYKDVKNENLSGSYKPIIFDEDATDSIREVGRFVRHPDLIEKENSLADKQEQKTKRDPFWRAKQQYNKVIQEKLDKRQEIEQVKEERKQKLEEYKKKKQERFKKLSRKTKKGQPVMTGRMELLLEKIQNDSKK